METASQMVGKAVDWVQDAIAGAAIWLPRPLQNLSRPNYIPLTGSDVFICRFLVRTSDSTEAAQVFACQADRLAPAPIETLSWAVARLDDNYWASAMAGNDALEAMQGGSPAGSRAVAGYHYVSQTGEEFVIRTAADRHRRRSRFLARVVAIALVVAGALMLAASLQARAERSYAQARSEQQARLVELRELSAEVSKRAALAQLGEIDIAQTIALLDAVSASLPETMAVRSFQLTGQELELTWQSPSNQRPSGLVTLLEGIAVPGSMSMQASASGSGESGDQVQLTMTLRGAER